MCHQANVNMSHICVDLRHPSIPIPQFPRIARNIYTCTTDLLRLPSVSIRVSAVGYIQVTSKNQRLPTAKMGSDPWESHRLRPSRSTISRSSDGSASIVIHSPTSPNDHHSMSLEHSPQAYLRPPNSPSNTDGSSSTLASPTWERSQISRRWKSAG